MRYLSSILAVVAIMCGFLTGHATDLDKMAYHDATDFTIINRGFDDTSTPYTRLPASLYTGMRDGLKTVADNSAGIAIRFATNSTAIGVKYCLTNNFHMNHMADTGTKGTDLYVMHDDGTWHFVATSIPGKDATNNKKYVDNLDGKMHEYMIYLPLYDGIKWLKIGVDKMAKITKPAVNSPRRDMKMVFYGTSITQGGCASRTGMVVTSILQRQLNVECINLGFSGQGRLDHFVARAMAKIPDVAAYVIDPVSNCKTEMVDSLAVKFVNILLEGSPNSVVFLVEGQVYASEPYDTKQQLKMPETNRMLHAKFLELKQQHPDRVFYIDRKDLIGPDGEGTVDGAHLTDYGFVMQAAKFRPYIEAVINGTEIPFQQGIETLYSK